MKIVMSSGHGKYIRGAEGPSPWGLDEVDEARRVVEQAAKELRKMGVDVTTYHDDVSDDQSENLERIVSFHNAQGAHDLDVSVHFNSADFNGSNWTSNPVGHEVWYKTSGGKTMAKQVCDTVCSAVPFKNRGPKQTNNLAFLNNTAEIAVLIEVCFVNSKGDVNIYNPRFNDICAAIASGLAGEDVQPGPEPEPEPEPGDVLFSAEGKCSYFGGPNDTGVSPSEGLAFIYEVDEAPQLFLPYQPSGTSGLARRLNPWVHYVACRWDYDVTPKEMLKGEKMAWVRSTSTGLGMKAFPADWGPNENTGRVADLSPSLMDDLGLTTDDEVEVTYPHEGE
jgi:N-acetylmuramoyl-L-alanine amidase